MRLIQHFRTQFDVELTEWFSAKRKYYSAMYAEDLLFFRLFDATESISLAGGKRVRPYMAAVLYEAVTKKAPTNMMPFFAIELFHVFLLIHDDITDGGNSRRGVPTLHRRMIDEQYDGNTHIGHSQAMIMGDMVHSWCHELFDESEYDAEVRLEVKQLFSKMSEAVMIGQMIDVHLTMQESTTRERIIEKMRLKTASYTFVYPLQIGIALGGGNKQLMEFAETFGTALGLAFQIQDDLLDILGDESVTGKTPMRDIVEGQPTLITQHVFESGSAEDKAILNQYLKKSVSSDAVPILREMFVRSGAIAAARQEASEHFQAAETALSAVDIDDATRAELSSGIAYIRSLDV